MVWPISRGKRAHLDAPNHSDLRDQIYVVASVFIYSLVLISIIDTKPSPSLYHALTWSMGSLIEAFLLGATLAVYTSEHREPMAGSPNGGKLERHMTPWEASEVVIDTVRLISLLSLVFLYALFICLRLTKSESRHAENGTAEETTGLLNGHETPNGTANGTANGNANAQSYGGTDGRQKDVDEPAAWVRPDVIPSKTWWEYVRAYSLFLPYLWPARSTRLQVLLVLCCTLIAAARVINVLVPKQAEKITNTLSGEDGPVHVPWIQILLYIFYRMLQGNSGIITGLRDYLWTPVSQFSFRELSVASFEHVHSLSLEFHLGKKTGEVLSALNKGSSINTFLGQVTFQFIPMIADLSIAIGYFLIEFDAYYALVVTLIAFFYMYLTIRMAQWRTKIRRDMTNLERVQEAVK